MLLILALLGLQTQAPTPAPTPKKNLFMGNTTQATTPGQNKDSRLSPTPGQSTSTPGTTTAPVEPPPAITQPLPSYSGQHREDATGTAPATLTPLEVQAAIYHAAGLPEVFTEASFTIPNLRGLFLEIADANIGFSNPGLVEVSYWIDSGDGTPPLPRKSTMLAGWGILPLGEHLGKTCSIRTNRPVFIYVTRLSDNLIFGVDRRLLTNKMVAPKTSTRRVQLLSRNVREELLPKNATAIQFHPDTAQQWANFMAMVSNR